MPVIASGKDGIVSLQVQSHGDDHAMVIVTFKNGSGKRRSETRHLKRAENGGWVGPNLTRNVQMRAEAIQRKRVAETRLTNVQSEIKERRGHLETLQKELKGRLSRERREAIRVARNRAKEALELLDVELEKAQDEASAMSTQAANALTAHPDIVEYQI